MHSFKCSVNATQPLADVDFVPSCEIPGMILGVIIKLWSFRQRQKVFHMTRHSVFNF